MTTEGRTTPDDTLSTAPETSETYKPLSILPRFYFYGLHGFMYEMLFTSLYDFVEKGDLQLKGHSSIHSFFIYGSCALFSERIFVKLQDEYRMSMLKRSMIYFPFLYMWELVSGLVLRQFGACPWDYSHYTYNFLGLITLEYAPGWLALILYQNLVYKYLFNLHVRVVTGTKTKTE